MFSTMLKSLVAVSHKQNNNNSESKQNSIEHTRTQSDYVFKLLNEIKDDNSPENIVVPNVVPLDITTNGLLIDSDLVNSVNHNKNIGEKNQIPIEPHTKEPQLLDQIKSLHCLFTWNLKRQKKQDIITHIENKYGSYNLDISVSEFTFVR